MNIGQIMLGALSLFLNIMSWLVLIRCLLSIIRIKENKINDLIYVLTEPLLKLIRDLLYKSSFMRDSRIDFSPMILIIIFSILDEIIRF